MPTGIGEWAVILLIVLIVFGASRLPQIGEGLGKAVRGLKRGLSSDDDIEVAPKSKQVSESSSAKSARAEVSEADVVEKKT